MDGEESTEIDPKKAAQRRVVRVEVWNVDLAADFDVVENLDRNDDVDRAVVGVDLEDGAKLVPESIENFHGFSMTARMVRISWLVGALVTTGAVASHANSAAWMRSSRVSEAASLPRSSSNKSPRTYSHAASSNADGRHIMRSACFVVGSSAARLIKKGWLPNCLRPASYACASVAKAPDSSSPLIKRYFPACSRRKSSFFRLKYASSVSSAMGVLSRKVVTARAAGYATTDVSAHAPYHISPRRCRHERTSRCDG